MDMFDRLLILSDYCGDTLFVNNISSYDHSMVPRPVPRVVPRSRLRGEDVKGSSSNTNEATTTPAYYILLVASRALLVGLDLCQVGLELSHQLAFAAHRPQDRRRPLSQLRQPRTL
eukprot:1667021-Pyramimonas_sp.AAC.1